jgi:hypothetical protein
MLSRDCVYAIGLQPKTSTRDHRPPGVEVLEKMKGIAENVSAHLMNDTNTIFQIGLITKLFTALVILKLQEEGKLSVVVLFSFPPENRPLRN